MWKLKIYYPFLIFPCVHVYVAYVREDSEALQALKVFKWGLWVWRWLLFHSKIFTHLSFLCEMNYFLSSSAISQASHPAPALRMALVCLSTVPRGCLTAGRVCRFTINCSFLHSEFECFIYKAHILSYFSWCETGWIVLMRIPCWICNDNNFESVLSPYECGVKGVFDVSFGALRKYFIYYSMSLLVQIVNIFQWNTDFP